MIYPSLEKLGGVHFVGFLLRGYRKEISLKGLSPSGLSYKRTTRHSSGLFARWKKFVVLHEKIDCIYTLCMVVRN